MTDFNLDLSTTSLAGHSLGGHCAGVTGTRLTTGKVARVTGEQRCTYDHSRTVYIVLNYQLNKFDDNT